MNITKTFRILLLGAVSLFVTQWANAETPAATAAAASPLAPIAFLIAHEWDAKLPDSPDGKKTTIHAEFTWSRNGHAIRMSSQFVSGGKRAPYIDGLYAWDPQQHVIVFWYVDAKGSLTKGTVKIEDGKLVHEFQETQPDGKIGDYVARVTPHGDQSWENEIFSRKDGKLAPIVKVLYEIAGK